MPPRKVDTIDLANDGALEEAIKTIVRNNENKAIVLNSVRIVDHKGREYIVLLMNAL